MAAKPTWLVKLEQRVIRARNAWRASLKDDKFEETDRSYLWGKFQGFQEAQDLLERELNHDPSAAD
jgi:hypothetical protein